MEITLFTTVLIAGLTTGGLTCFAVQGGLLTSLLTQMQKKRQEQGIQTKLGLVPVFAFITAKLIVYILFGALLGAVGSLFDLSTTVQAIIQLICGIYMIGVACQLLNLHPLFRYFIIQPPQRISRIVRKVAKGNDEIASPIALGALTLFIPCGTTLAMEALAISTGNPVSAALIMGLFTIATSWVFVAIGFAQHLITPKTEIYAFRITAALLMILGLYTINTSLYLLNVPFATDLLAASNNKPQPSTQQIPADFENVQKVYISVTSSGYKPDKLRLKKNVPAEITLETNGVYTCALAFTIPSLNIKKVLQPDGVEKFTFTPTKSGRLPYSCSMGMYRGDFIVE